MFSYQFCVTSVISHQNDIENIYSSFLHCLGLWSKFQCQVFQLLPRDPAYIAPALIAPASTAPASFFKAPSNASLTFRFISLFSCPGDWIDLGDYGCFYFAAEAYPMNWKDAQTYCRYMDQRANLAAIPDPTTQAFLAALAEEYEDQAWLIGATDEYDVISLNILIFNQILTIL